MVSAESSPLNGTRRESVNPVPSANEGYSDGRDVSNIEDLPNVTPRDVRLLHLIMASLGVNSYQDRVPLQIMDFAYRYTHGVLQDSLHYCDHSHSNSKGSLTTAGLAPTTNAQLTIEDVRLAVAARVNYQFKPAPPKEMLMELAAERNKKPLPPIPQQWGLRLPPEKYCLTGKEWDFDEEKDEIMTDEVLVENKEDVEMEL